MPRLRVKRIDTVGFVDKGDDPEAEIVFWKRQGGEPEGGTDSDEGDDAMAKDAGDDQGRSVLKRLLDFLKNEVGEDMSGTDEGASEGFDVSKLESDDAREAFEALTEKLESAEERISGLEGELEKAKADDAGEGADEGAEGDVLKGLDDEARSAFEKLQSRAEEAEDRLQETAEKVDKLREESETQEFAKTAREEIPLLADGDGAEAGRVLKAMSDALDEDMYKSVFTMLKSANEVATQGKVFQEWGSPGADTNDAWGKIEAKADELVTKSEDGLSKAQAVSKVLETDEGRKLYNEYLSSDSGS